MSENSNDESDAHNDSANAESYEAASSNADNQPYTAKTNSPEPPNWVEKGTLIVLTMTLFAAGLAGYEAARLADLTQTAMADAKLLSDQQRLDTQRALSAAEKAANAATDSAKATKDVAARILTQAKASNRLASSAADQASLLKEQNQMIVRPWIKITDIKTRGNNPIVPALSFQDIGPFDGITKQATFQLQISLKNIGHSMANATVSFELFLPLWKNGYSDTIIAEQKKFCDTFAKAKSTNPSLKIVLFPDEPFDWHGAGAAIIRPENTNYFSDRSSDGYIVPVVIACVNYQFRDSPEIFQTRALYEIFRSDDRTRFFEVGRGTPADQIFMIRNQFADDAY